MTMTRGLTARGAGRARGITLIETIVSVLIVAGLFVAAISTLGAARSAESRTAERLHAQALAEDLLSEVLARPYHHPASPALAAADASDDSDRLGYQSVNDYHRWRSAPPTMPDGTAMAGYEGFSRDVEVAWVDPATLEAATSDTGVKRITVRVHRGDLLLAERVALRTAAWSEPVLAGESWRE